MLQFSDLVKLDPSFKFVTVEPTKFSIEEISNAIKPEPNSFIFVKGIRFLKSIGRLSTEKEFLQTGCVLEEKYFEEIKDTDTFNEIAKKFSWVATTKNVNYSMCVYSKPLYDELYGKLNYHIDGRQLNKTEIHVDAEIAQNVFVGSGAKIGKDVKILSGAVIMPNVEIGDGTIVFPNVVIYPYTKIGKNCRIHANVTLGADGFGYNFFNGEHLKVWHLKGVIIEDEVEIGANSCVDAGAFIATKVGFGTKLDNFVQIAHNNQVGRYNVFASQAGLAGSCETGDYCAFGAGAGFAPGVRSGKGCQLAARAVVSENSILKDGEVLAGHPARPLKEWLKSQAKIRQITKA